MPSPLSTSSGLAPSGTNIATALVRPAEAHAEVAARRGAAGHGNGVQLRPLGSYDTNEVGKGGPGKLDHGTAYYPALAPCGRRA